ncbi:hypothetical protein P4I81_04525 [Bacillus cereus]|uniref:Gp24 n=4 Tax=root TaxID=1 RepID=B8R889_9CAUD|nr:MULTISPECIES: hypothetical protein [Bacillus cereus group]YP_002333585.1 gp24 [Bacillus phage TP21-L]ANT40039.1 hypothetical protein BMBtpLA3_4 [Bacillus phage BMBtpLA3]ACJ70550.1 gp24 [Bacillus phage TP21-L]EXY08875.1 hypothetical protein BF15_04685 [Bacillus thuringiensis]MCU4871084.1 hypothetical protein [Bacillus cereus]MDN4873162.1 hypothetical protein [Bacillus cereus]
MSKKKRHYTKGPQVIEKVVEIHKQPTLQEAWDVVCEHLAVEYRNREISWFVDCVGTYGHSLGDVVLHTGGYDAKKLVVSSKNYKKDLGW